MSDDVSIFKDLNNLAFRHTHTFSTDISLCNGQNSLALTTQRMKKIKCVLATPTLDVSLWKCHPQDGVHAIHVNKSHAHFLCCAQIGQTKHHVCMVIRPNGCSTVVSLIPEWRLSACVAPSSNKAKCSSCLSRSRVLFPSCR